LSFPSRTARFSRAAKIEDTTIGWRFVNPLMKSKYGIDSMPETAENVAHEFQGGARRPGRLCAAKPAALAAAQAKGFYRDEIIPVSVTGKKGAAIVVDRDEHPPGRVAGGAREVEGVVRPEGTVTAGNASGVNDGACAMILASEAAAKKHKLEAKARVLAWRRRAWRRASWASVPRRRPGKCWRKPG